MQHYLQNLMLAKCFNPSHIILFFLSELLINDRTISVSSSLSPFFKLGRKYKQENDKKIEMERKVPA